MKSAGYISQHKGPGFNPQYKRGREERTEEGRKERNKEKRKIKEGEREAQATH